MEKTEKELWRPQQLIAHDIDEVLEMMDSPGHYSVYEDYGDFQILVIRRMHLAQKSLSFRSEAFIFKNKKVYRFDQAKKGFSLVESGFSGLVNHLEDYYLNNQKVLTIYSDEIERLEDYLFQRSIPSYFMDLWFDLKKDLSKIENYYYRNGLVYREFHKKCAHQFGDRSDEFKDIDDTIQFQSSHVGALKGRVDGLHHYHDSIKSDHLNKTLLMLTVISGVFLPLNLIVGFFGMNTSGLYLRNDPEGTQKVLLLLVGIFAFSLIGIKIIRLIDHFVLRFVLGKYDFYKNISRRLAKFEEGLKNK